MTDPEHESDGAFLAHTAKDGRTQLLRDHLLAASEAAGGFAGNIGVDGAGTLLGLLHDLGKYSADFQRYLRQMSLDQDTEQQTQERGKIDHSTAGAQTVLRRLKQRGVQDGIAGEILALCLASHHSGLIDCILPSGKDNLTERIQKPDTESHHDEAWRNVEPPVAERITEIIEDSEFSNSLLDVMRRICRTDSPEKLRRFKVGLLTRYLFSCLVDADHTDSADFERPPAASPRQRGEYQDWTVLKQRLEAELERFSAERPIDQLRKEVSRQCLDAGDRPRGIYTLTAPTGGGKTLASLRFALKHAAEREMDRIIYVSPYTSIIDQNADVVRKILEPEGSEFASVVLEHHSNLTPLEQTDRSKVLSENWDAPVVFTTFVQFLEALFGAGARSTRRMHRMAKAVLVFDEIQTLPVRCVHLFNNAINFLVEQCGSSVLLCTATQPLLDQVDASKGAVRLGKNAELMKDAASLFRQFDRQTVTDERKPGGWTHEEVAALAISETRETGSCLVVVNTKSEARSIFQKCRAEAPDIERFHLSTGMCPAHRLDALEAINERLAEGAPTICVSTQLIEAGVDISFRSAIRALAGLDSIAQAAGRCNRHGECEVGRVHVVNLTGELPAALIDIRKAQEAAQRVFDEDAARTKEGQVDRSDLGLMERYFRYYFFDRRHEMDYPVSADKAGRDDTLLDMLGENRQAVSASAFPPPIYMRQSFKTAAEAFEPIETATQGVIVPYGSEGRGVIADLCAAHEVGKQFKLLKSAQRFTVNVFPNLLKRLQEAGALHEVQEGTGILYLNERYYNSDFGLNQEGSEEMEAKIE